MRKTFWFNALFCFAALFILVAMGRFFYDKFGFRKDPAPRREMKLLLSQLQLGDSSLQVRNRFQRGNFRYLKLDSRDPTSWVINTPLEMGAKNWTLYLEFDSKAKLAAIRLRTPDGTNIRPTDVTVSDRVRSNWISPRADYWEPPNK